MGGGRVKVYFDGGCRPNPGEMEVAVVAGGVVYARERIGHGSNSDAEWLALIHAAETAGSLGLADVEFIGDSALVVHQASGAWKCRSPELRAHRDAYLAAVAGFARVRLKHVPRSKNLAGIALAARRR